MSHARKLSLLGTLSSLALLTVSAPALATTYSISNSTLNAGGRFCLTPLYSPSYIDTQGTASPGLDFTVHWSADNVTYQKIYECGTACIGFHATFIYGYPQWPGTGWFKVCARNSGTTGSTFSMSITDQAQ